MSKCIIKVVDFFSLTYVLNLNCHDFGTIIDRFGRRNVATLRAYSLQQVTHHKWGKDLYKL